MATRRPAQWRDTPSSGDLAALVRCEAEFVWERNTGRISASPERQARAARGEAAHDRTQREMERFHNARRPASAPRSVPEPAPRTVVAPAPQIQASRAGALSVPSTPARAPAPHTPPSATDRRCLIATALYGPDDPRTQALRRFRDTHLLPSGLGRVAVAVYYRLSPHLVPVLVRWPVLAGWARAALDLLRSRLPA